MTLSYPLSSSHLTHQNNLPKILSSSSQNTLPSPQRDTRVAMAASLQAASTLMPTKMGLPTRSNLKSSHSISKAFGLESCASKLSCSLQADFKDLAQKCLDATKLAGFALASSALLVSVCCLLSFFLNI